MLFKIDRGQRGNPHGLIGGYALHKMRRKHWDVYAFARDLFELKEEYNVLDIGCGHGYHLREMLKVCKMGVGIDISHLSVKRARRANKRAIKENRCMIIDGDIRAFSLDLSFNIAIAYCTVGFWENKLESFKKIYSLLADGGAFIIAGHQRHNYTEVEALLKEAGFSELIIKEAEGLFAIKAIK